MAQPLWTNWHINTWIHCVFSWIKWLYFVINFTGVWLGGLCGSAFTLGNCSVLTRQQAMTWTKVNSLGPHRATMAQVMACYRTASSHYLNQCWLLISVVLWHSPESKFTVSAQVTILLFLYLYGCENFSHTYLHTQTSIFISKYENKILVSFHQIKSISRPVLNWTKQSLHMVSNIHKIQWSAL